MKLWAPDLDVLAEEEHATVRVLVARPFCSVHGDLARVIHAMEWYLRKVLDFVYILLADALALLAVVQVVARERGGDTNEDEPVARG